jgi:hypothetical protein
MTLYFYNTFNYKIKSINQLCDFIEEPQDDEIYIILGHQKSYIAFGQYKYYKESENKPEKVYFLKVIDTYHYYNQYIYYIINRYLSDLIKKEDFNENILDIKYYKNIKLNVIRKEIQKIIIYMYDKYLINLENNYDNFIKIIDDKIEKEKGNFINQNIIISKEKKEELLISINYINEINNDIKDQKKLGFKHNLTDINFINIIYPNIKKISDICDFVDKPKNNKKYIILGHEQEFIKFKTLKEYKEMKNKPNKVYFLKIKNEEIYDYIYIYYNIKNAILNKIIKNTVFDNNFNIDYYKNFELQLHDKSIQENEIKAFKMNLNILNNLFRNVNNKNSHMSSYSKFMEFSKMTENYKEMIHNTYSNYLYDIEFIKKICYIMNDFNDKDENEYIIINHINNTINYGFYNPNLKHVYYLKTKNEKYYRNKYIYYILESYLKPDNIFNSKEYYENLKIKYVHEDIQDLYIECYEYGLKKYKNCLYNSKEEMIESVRKDIKEKLKQYY